MSANQAADLASNAPDLDEGQVLAYLQAHPELLTRDPEFLGELRIPHAAGGAVSLIERQVDTLRRENNDLKQRLDQLIRLAHDNDQLNHRLHQLTLELIDAADFDEVLTIIEDQLHDQFKADAVELRLFSATRLRGENDQGPGDPELEAVLDFFDAGRPLCGPLDRKPMDTLFGGEADDIQSAAVMPLSGDDILGVLAVGSQDPQRFHPDMGTDFLVRLAEVVMRKLQVVSLPGV